MNKHAESSLQDWVRQSPSDDPGPSEKFLGAVAEARRCRARARRAGAGACAIGLVALSAWMLLRPAPVGPSGPGQRANRASIVVGTTPCDTSAIALMRANRGAGEESSGVVLPTCVSVAWVRSVPQL